MTPNGYRFSRFSFLTFQITEHPHLLKDCDFSLMCKELFVFAVFSEVTICNSQNRLRSVLRVVLVTVLSNR